MVPATLPSPGWAGTHSTPKIQVGAMARIWQLLPCYLSETAGAVLLGEDKGHPWKGSCIEYKPDRHLMTKSKE